MAFAHSMWRRLPYHARRQLLFCVTSQIAAAPCDRALRAPPVFVAGFLSAASGLGEMARALHDAYAARGVPVYGIDLSREFRQGSSSENFAFVDGRKHRGEGTVILAVSGPFVPLALLLLGPRFLKRKWRIGYWAWELQALPQEWKNGARLLHEIWTISNFAGQAISAGLDRDVRVVLPPIPAHPGSRSIDPAKFRVLVAFNMASSFARKNPLAAIAAFKDAFGNSSDAHLRVQIANPSAYPDGLRMIETSCRGYDNIQISAGTCPHSDLIDLIRSSDALLSLHRSEGLGLMFAHAMHLGTPVIATGWSGNLDILSERNSFLVSAGLVEVNDPQKTYEWAGMRWANPSIAVAVQALRALYLDRTVGEERARWARLDATRLFDPSMVPEILG
jgi:glycosyltransferase involved in cell wall biosynthesis